MYSGAPAGLLSSHTIVATLRKDLKTTLWLFLTPFVVSTTGILNTWHKRAKIGDRIFVDTFEVYQWLEGRATAEFYGTGQGHPSYLVMGSYVEGLHPHADRCKWFTVFRHPISRVVSAYYHCQVGYEWSSYKRTIEGNGLRFREVTLEG